MAEIADDLLPVFPFRINWRGGLSERLEWKTDVLGDFKGNEQRRGLRLTPRREFEATLSLWDQDRAFWDLWLHRMAGTEFLLPLWHDSVRASQDAPQGQNTVWADTRGLEFRTGSYGLLRGNTALSYERIEIAEVHDDHLVTVDPLAADWPRGTRVEPLVRARMTDQTNVSAKSSRASEAQAAFECTHAQPYDEGEDPWDQYAGLPVLTLQPNRSEDVSAAYNWSFSESDSLTGRRYRRSDTERAMVHQKHSWLLHGRTAKAAFRSLLYRLRGQQGPFWLPTFNDDLHVSRDRPAASTSIYIKSIGFAYTGGPSSGREFICIFLKDGTRLYRKIIGTAASGSLTEERLTLDAPLVTGLNMADVRSISWMDTARFENDRIELNHINAADGATTVAGIFQTFRNERIVPAILSLPIPAAIKSPDRCGTDIPEIDSCAPAAAIFSGWWLKFHVDFWPAECGPVEFPNTFLDVYPDTTSTGPPIALSIDASHQGTGAPGDAVQLIFQPGEHTVQYLEYTLWQNANLWSQFPDDPTQDERLYWLRIQFPPAVFTCTFARYMRVTVKRWNDPPEAPWEVIPCAWGNTVPLFEGTDADVEGIWPRDYGYIF